MEFDNLFDMDINAILDEVDKEVTEIGIDSSYIGNQRAEEKISSLFEEEVATEIKEELVIKTEPLKIENEYEHYLLQSRMCGVDISVFFDDIEDSYEIPKPLHQEEDNQEVIDIEKIERRKEVGEVFEDRREIFWEEEEIEEIEEPEPIEPEPEPDVDLSDFGIEEEEEPQEPIEIKEPREPQEPIEIKEPREPQEPIEIKEPQELQEQDKIKEQNKISLAFEVEEPIETSEEDEDFEEALKELEEMAQAKPQQVTIPKTGTYSLEELNPPNTRWEQ